METSTGDTFDADMHGHLGFWPQESMINAIKELHHTGDTTETEEDDCSAPDPNPNQGMGVTMTEATGGSPEVQPEISDDKLIQEDPKPNLDGSQQPGIAPEQQIQHPGMARADPEIPEIAMTEATANQEHIERLEKVRAIVRSKRQA